VVALARENAHRRVQQQSALLLLRIGAVRHSARV
jgi:hypothetical protein